MNTRFKLLVATTLLLSAVLTPAHAAPLSVEASDNATVQPAGPRPGANGKNFFNIEGSANNAFASYGVADFNFGPLGMTVLDINSINLGLTQANAAFSTTGVVVFSVDQRAPLSDIQPVTSPLAFDGADPGTATDVGQGDLTLLALGGGPFSYVVGASGDLNTYNFVLDAATEAELISRLNAGATIRIVVGTGQTNLAATWAGFSNNTFTGPTLNLDVTYDTGTPSEPQSWGRIKAAYRD